MILVIGGAYQGKQAFVCEHFGLAETDIRACTQMQRVLEEGVRCYAHTERIVRGLVEEGSSAEAFWREQLPAMKDMILIAEDFSCGLVPMDAKLRLWREENGRTNSLLAAHADEVWRVFCGLGQRLK